MCCINHRWRKSESIIFVKSMYYAHCAYRKYIDSELHDWIVTRKITRIRKAVIIFNVRVEHDSRKRRRCVAEMFQRDKFIFHTLVILVVFFFCYSSFEKTKMYERSHLWLILRFNYPIRLILHTMIIDESLLLENDTGTNTNFKS